MLRFKPRHPRRLLAISREDPRQPAIRQVVQPLIVPSTTGTTDLPVLASNPSTPPQGKPQRMNLVPWLGHPPMGQVDEKQAQYHICVVEAEARLSSR